MCFNGANTVSFWASRTWPTRFCLRPLLAAAIMAVLGDAQAEAISPPPRLTVQPTQCVVLEQGQKCHANTQIKWQSDQPRSICLHSSLGQKPIKCWQDAIKGVYKEKVVSRSSVYYILKPLHGGEVLAKAELNVAWVYRESRRPSRQWRLF